MKYQMEEMFPDEFLAAVKRAPVFILPTGLMEWHGDHLPLGQDAMKAHGLCLTIASELGYGIVLPANYIGRPGYSTYTGTMTYSEALLTLLLTEELGQIEKLGGRVVYILTGHYGPCQVDVVKKVAHTFNLEHPSMRVIAAPEYEDVLVDGVTPADHAGKWETAMFRHFYPDKARMSHLKPVPQPMKLYENAPNDYYHESPDWHWDNDVENGTPELGAAAAQAVAKVVADRIRGALAELNIEVE